MLAAQALRWTGCAAVLLGYSSIPLVSGALNKAYKASFTSLWTAKMVASVVAV
jgi:hypothetical protein